MGSALECSGCFLGGLWSQGGQEELPGGSCVLRVLLEQDSAVPQLQGRTGSRDSTKAEICSVPARGGSRKAAAGRVGWFVINSGREFLHLLLQPGLEAVL